MKEKIRSDSVIHFIICDDNAVMRKSILKIISKFMMSKELEYKSFVFNDYNDEFLEIVNQKLPFKIYILDIEVPTRTGIDVARILAKDITFLAFINKFDDYKNRLQYNIRKALSALEKKKCLRFDDHGTLYALPFKDILYVIKDSLTRKTVIVTEYKDFSVYKPLAYFIELLAEDFVQTHRACLVNKERIMCFDKKERLIIFDNGVKLDLVSTRFKAEELAV